jgi:hypothetical protein
MRGIQSFVSIISPQTPQNVHTMFSLSVLRTEDEPKMVLRTIQKFQTPLGGLN